MMEFLAVNLKKQNVSLIPKILIRDCLIVKEELHY